MLSLIRRFRLRNFLYHKLAAARCAVYRRAFGMTIGTGVRISGKARMDFTNPRGVHVGDYTLISFDASILTHDFINHRHVDTHIGANSFVGARAIVMPGVRVGAHCVVGAGSVVTKDVPDNTLVAGNPARALRSDIRTGRYGVLIDEGAPESAPPVRRPARPRRSKIRTGGYDVLVHEG